jgi:hypothetical protein
LAIINTKISFITDRAAAGHTKTKGLITIIKPMVMKLMFGIEAECPPLARSGSSAPP